MSGILSRYKLRAAPTVVKDYSGAKSTFQGFDVARELTLRNKTVKGAIVAATVGTKPSAST